MAADEDDEDDEDEENDEDDDDHEAGAVCSRRSEVRGISARPRQPPVDAVSSARGTALALSGLPTF